jgi:predicted AlkP superfamily pyrophosphatase or phosphodiesterase
MTSPPLKKKKIIMMIVDTLMDSSIQAAIKSGKAPAFQFFIEKGRYFSNLVSTFPTMSVNVDSTLLTGVSCDKHKVPGLVWYSQKEKRIVNYGSSAKELLKLGLKQSMVDILYNLNHVHLNKAHKTIHELFHDRGLQTASINALLYRGSNHAELKLPLLLSWLTGLNRKINSYSPDLFSYGALHRLGRSKKNAFFWKKYGFNDPFSTDELNHLIRQKKLPPLTIVYFPDLDQSVHKNGRTDIKGIQKVDKQLQKILNQYESWDDAIAENIWIILGDNGQAWIHQNRKEALIDLRKLLGSYQIVKLHQGVTSKDEIVLGVNQRMSFIYTLDPHKVPLEGIAKKLKTDHRIDVIAIKNGKAITVTSGIHSGELQFYPGGDFVDEYGQSWFIDGNMKILDLTLTENKVCYGDYPDALARLYAPFFSHDGNYLIVTAKPGHEFIGEGSPTHVGGASHGGLHKQDSLVSMIICGTNTTPKHLRTLEIKDWVMSLV